MLYGSNVHLTFATHQENRNFLFFFISAFGSHFYPKGFTLHSGESLSIHAFPGTQTHDLAIAGTTQHKALPSIDKIKTLMQSGFTG